MFAEMTSRFEGNKIHSSPGDQSLSDQAVNISQVTVNCFLFGFTVFTMLPTRGIGKKQFHC